LSIALGIASDPAKMRFGDLPELAAWRHRGVRGGFEVVFMGSGQTGFCFAGGSAAVEPPEAWVVNYVIALDSDWLTRSARLSARSGRGWHELSLDADGAGGWTINGVAAPHLDGCLDVDLEASALTNAFPIHRLRLERGEAADAPATYVRAVDLTVERLEQRYVRLDADGTGERYHYTAPGFGFECQLDYDESGLVCDYPGLATRAA
jgi:uncharacterized protein